MAIHDGLIAVIEQFRAARGGGRGDTFVNTNAAATLKLGQARGIAMLVPAQAGLTVAEYAPNLVKKTVVGAGHGEKAQIRMMIGVLLPKADPQSEDAADALAIAVLPRASSARSVGAEGGGVMIGKLKGIVDSYGEDYVILDVNGVGYQVHCSARTLAGAAGAGRGRDAVDRDLRARGPDQAVRLSRATSSANGSACCRRCRASAPRSRCRCSAR